MERLPGSQRRGILTLLALLCAGGVCQAQFQPAAFERLDRFMEEQLRAANVPGAAVAVINREQAVHLRGYGIAGPVGDSVTPDTPFIIASVSKPITALAVMRLVEAGRVELDAPVRRYLPWFEVLPREQSERISLRHLLTHTSGLSVRDGRLAFSSRDNSDVALQTRVRQLANARLGEAPGARYEYSNANYDALAAVVEAVTGGRFERYVESAVFLPLKMNRSFTSVDVARGHGLAQGHRYWFGRPVVTESLPRPRSMAASGMLISSGADLARLLRMHLNHGTLDGERILSPESTEMMQRPSAPVGGSTYYALGWFVENIDGRRIVWHGGNGPDYSARVVLAPDEGWGFAFLANAENYLSGPAVGSLGREVRQLLMGRTPQPIRKASGLFTPTLLALALLLVVQALAALHTLIVARRWKRNPHRRPRGRLRLAWHFVLPLFATGALTVLLLVVMPRMNDANFSNVLIHAPDAALLGVLSVAFACTWAAVRTVLLLRSPRTAGERAASDYAR
jgi:CubicO group peptidase (beta-lactamase class C family)